MNNDTAKQNVVPEQEQGESAWEEFERRFPGYRLSDIKAYVRDPKLYLAGDGFFKRGAMNALTSKTTAGKSVFSEQVSVSMAAGVDLIGGIKVHNPVRVLHWQSENDLDTLNSHVTAIEKHLKANPKLVEKNLLMRQVFGIAGQDCCDWLREDAKRFKPDFVVLDHYQSYMGGDINSAEDFNNWYYPIHSLMQEMNFGVMIVCHTPKIKEGKDVPTYDAIYQAAGSAALANSVRTGWFLLREGDESSGRYRLFFSKIPVSTGLRDEKGHVVKSLYVEHSDDPSQPYWRVCESQTGAVRVDPLETLITTMRKHPKMDKMEIIALKVPGLKKTSVYDNWVEAKNRLGRK